MTGVAKFVQSMPRHFTWVRLLNYLLFKWDWKAVLYVYYQGLMFILLRVFAGTMLMTPERRKAIWAIYGEALCPVFRFVALDVEFRC